MIHQDLDSLAPLPLAPAPNVSLGIANVTPRPPQILIIGGIVPYQRTPMRMLVVHIPLLSLLNIRGGSGIRLLVARVRILAPLADLGPVAPEQEGDTAARQTDEGEQSGRPAVVEPVVHLLGEEDDGGTPEAADKSLGGEGGGGLVLVRVDEVVVGRVVEEDEAEADGEAAHCGTRPRELRVGGPGEDEEADGDEPAGEHHGDEADLGGRVAVVLGDELEVVLVDEGRADGGEDDSYGDRDEHEARLAGRVALALLVDDGEGDEEHVEEAVENAHVEGDEEDDELAEEELEGADHEDGEALLHGAGVDVLSGNMAVVASLGAELFGAGGEDGGSVRLRDGEGDEDPDDAGEDELDPVQPAPAGGIGEVATDERTNCEEMLASWGLLREKGEQVFIFGITYWQDQ